MGRAVIGVREDAVWWALVACVAEPGTTGVEPVVPENDEGPVEVRLGFPVDDPGAISTVVGVDHDPVVAANRLEELVCADYLGRPFPHCYDEHDGSDYLLDGGFEAMDAGSAGVVAAADGVVVSVEDGHYDRCHGTPEGVDCDGHDGVANHVVVAHEDGTETRYWHLMKGSVAVAVDEAVTRGQALGRIGSSGYSSMPHLHFEVVVDGVVVDPYAGPLSQETSWWCDQGPPDGLPGGCD